MALGVDALLKSLLNVIGFDPAEFMKGMQSFVEHVYRRLEDFDSRIADIEKSLLLLHQKIDAIPTGRNPENVRSLAYDPPSPVADDPTEQPGPDPASGGE